MIYISSALLVFFLWMIFWQGSMLVASIAGVPIVYTDSAAIRDAWRLAGIKKGDRVVDLGCGNGRTLIIAAKEFGATGIGVDRSLFCVLKSRLNVWVAGESKRIKIIKGDFKKVEKEIYQADIVYLYLLNQVMKSIEPWIFESINNQTKIVSMAFYFDNHQPVQEVETRNLGVNTKVRLYTKSSKFTLLNSF